MRGRKRVIKGVANEPKIVKARECDVPMARSKGYLPCDQNCKTCFACIEILDSGDRQHFSYSATELQRRKKVQDE